MKSHRWRLWLLLPLAIAVCGSVIALASCGGKKPTDLEQPTHTLPFSERPPADAAEWVRLRNELDNARAENQRKDAEVAALIEERSSANAATWKRFGMFSWALVAPGIGLLIASFVFPMLAPARNAGVLLLGLGILFAALPHLIVTYGPWVFYPVAITAGGYVVTIAGLDIYGRVKRVKFLVAEANAESDPVRTALHLGAAVGIARSLNPSTDRAMSSADGVASQLAEIAATGEQVKPADIIGGKP